MKAYNANNDFTDMDKVKQNWIMLKENRFRQECEPVKDINQINWTKWLVILAFSVFIINWILR